MDVNTLRKDHSDVRSNHELAVLCDSIRRPHWPRHNRNPQRDGRPAVGRNYGCNRLRHRWRICLIAYSWDAGNDLFNCRSSSNQMASYEIGGLMYVKTISRSDKAQNNEVITTM